MPFKSQAQRRRFAQLLTAAGARWIEVEEDERKHVGPAKGLTTRREANLARA